MTQSQSAAAVVHPDEPTHERAVVMDDDGIITLSLEIQARTGLKPGRTIIVESHGPGSLELRMLPRGELVSVDKPSRIPVYRIDIPELDLSGVGFDPEVVRS